MMVGSCDVRSFERAGCTASMEGSDGEIREKKGASVQEVDRTM